MYRIRNTDKPSLKIKGKPFEGESIEEKMRRVTSNNEAISDGGAAIYTERKEGVLPEYNIRADKMELALEATDAISRHHLTKRAMRMGEKTYDTMTPGEQADFNKKFPKNKHAVAAAAAAAEAKTSNKGGGKEA